MKKGLKKAISLLMTLAMIVTLMPNHVFAVAQDDTTSTTSSMKITVKDEVDTLISGASVIATWGESGKQKLTTDANGIAEIDCSSITKGEAISLKISATGYDQKNVSVENRDDQTIVLSKTLSNNAKTVLDKTKSNSYMAEMSVYLYYTNALPASINQGFDKTLFGPEGNDTPYFKVKVDVRKLLYMKGMDATIKDGKWYISVDSCSGLDELISADKQAKGESSTTVTRQERLEKFWSNVLLCMSESDKTTITEYFSGHYRGYVVKNEGTGHIDGILDQTSPVYMTELYDGKTIVSVKSKSGETKSYVQKEGLAFSTVEEQIVTYLNKKVTGADFTIDKITSYSDLSTDNGIILTLTDKKTGNKYTVKLRGNSVSTIEEVNYPNYTKEVENTFYVARYHISEFTQKTTTLTVTKLWDDNNDIAGYRPDTLNVSLNTTSVSFSKDITLSKDNSWTWNAQVNVDDVTTSTYVNEATVTNYKNTSIVVKPATVVDGLVTEAPSITLTNEYNGPKSGTVTVIKQIPKASYDLLTELTAGTNPVVSGSALSVTVRLKDGKEDQQVTFPINSSTFEKVNVENGDSYYQASASIEGVPYGTCVFEETCENSGINVSTLSALVNADNANSELKTGTQSGTLKTTFSHKTDSNVVFKNTYSIDEKQNLATIKISKVDANTHEVISGSAISTAKFVLDPQTKGLDNIEFTNNQDGTFTLENVPNGVYDLIESDAPTGYSKAESITLTVSSDGITSIQENENGFFERIYNAIVEFFTGTTEDKTTAKGSYTITKGLDGIYNITVQDKHTNRSLTVSKTFKGLTREQINSLVGHEKDTEDFYIDVVSGADNEGLYYSDTLVLKEMPSDLSNSTEWTQNEDGSFTYTWPSMDIRSDIDYNLTEHNYTVDLYNTKTSGNEKVTAIEDGKEVTAATVDLVNIYSRQQGTIQVTKTFKGLTEDEFFKVVKDSTLTVYNEANKVVGTCTSDSMKYTPATTETDTGIGTITMTLTVDTGNYLVKDSKDIEDGIEGSRKYLVTTQNPEEDKKIIVIDSDEPSTADFIKTYNEKGKGTFNVRKYGYDLHNHVFLKKSLSRAVSSYNDISLSGVVFTLYNENEEEVTTATTDNNGTAIFSNIEPGNYTMRETKGSTGYALDSDEMYKIIVAKDGSVSITTKDGVAVSQRDVPAVPTDTENTDTIKALIIYNYRTYGYITVTKSFRNISKDQIASMTDFVITMKGAMGYKEEFRLTDEMVIVSDDGLTYTWKEDCVPTDTYTFTESGNELGGVWYTSAAYRDTDTENNSDGVVTVSEEEYSGETEELVNVYGMAITNAYSYYVYYNPIIDDVVVPIEDPDVPTDPGTGDDTTIDDGNTPTTDVPGDTNNDTNNKTNDEKADITENKTPTSGSPKTGDVGSFVWGALAVASAAGLAGFGLKKKKEDDEE